MWEKKAMEKVDQIVGRLVEGKSYLVPTVKGEWLDTHGIADWPVVGPRHKDEDLGVDVAAGIKTLKVSEPPKRSAGIKVPDVATLVAKLKTEAKVI